MTNREIKQELNKIYRERGKWHGGKGPFTLEEIKRREAILMRQNLLYRIEDAKLAGDKKEEALLTRLLLFMNRFTPGK